MRFIIFFFMITSICFAQENLIELDSAGFFKAGSRDNEIKVCLSNANVIRAVQLTIQDEPNFLILQENSGRTTERAKDLSLSMHEAKDGALNIVLISTDLNDNAKKVIQPDTGCIFSFKVSVSADAPPGPLKLVLLNPVIADTGWNKLQVSTKNSKLVIEEGTGVGDRSVKVHQYYLAQNYPNPFNPATQIEFGLPVENFIKLDIYNLLGQQIKNLVRGTMPPGRHKIKWNGLNDDGQPVPAGVYIYRLKSSKFTQTRRLMLIK